MAENMSWKINSDKGNGKNALFPALLPVRISTSNIFLNKPRHNNRVPINRPYLGSMFRNNIKGVIMALSTIYDAFHPCKSNCGKI
ncbi:hypothetical protein MTR_0086s0110 [Medicago truncatula]|uniref:Uncharacterized protein n=1 Tax=Medicago truncatula TaxID=3880 RepID=A0A072THE5_MEDTR|nr:hypothetical protein MTR_0086s0110 [Medicago truncatula]